MENLPSRDLELLMTYEKLARALEAMHLNHEQRQERIALIGRMLRSQMNYASPEFLTWLYPLYHVLLTLYLNTGTPIMTHREIKHGLRFFAELCMAARDDLETIYRNRGWGFLAKAAYEAPDQSFGPPENAVPQWTTVEIAADHSIPDGAVLTLIDYEPPTDPLDTHEFLIRDES